MLAGSGLKRLNTLYFEIWQFLSVVIAAQVKEWLATGRWRRVVAQFSNRTGLNPFKKLSSSVRYQIPFLKIDLFFSLKTKSELSQKLKNLSFYFALGFRDDAKVSSNSSFTKKKKFFALHFTLGTMHFCLLLRHCFFFFSVAFSQNSSAIKILHNFCKWRSPLESKHCIRMLKVFIYSRLLL